MAKSSLFLLYGELTLFNVIKFDAFEVNPPLKLIKSFAVSDLINSK